jgi:hypothetical protein
MATIRILVLILFVQTFLQYWFLEDVTNIPNLSLDSKVKMEAKVCMCITNNKQTYEDVWWREGITPPFLNSGLGKGRSDSTELKWG